MATRTVTIPDEYWGDVIAAARGALGEAADNLTDDQVFDQAVSRLMAMQVKSYRRRNKAGRQTKAVLKAEAALVAKEAAAVLARQARVDAEAEDDAVVDAAFGLV